MVKRLFNVRVSIIICLFQYVPLTVDSMCTLLYDVMNWEQFAIHLPNITSSDVERIQLNYHHSVHDCERALVKYWLSVHPKASWDDVMIALHEAGEQKLARNVMDMVKQSIYLMSFAINHCYAFSKICIH